METRINTEIDSMQIILHSGNAKSDSYEALMLVKEGDHAGFDEKMASAKTEINQAHRAHAELLRKLSSAERMEDVDLLMVHAEGHLTSTNVAVDMISEMGELIKWKNDSTK